MRPSRNPKKLDPVPYWVWEKADPDLRRWWNCGLDVALRLTSPERPRGERPPA